MKKKSFGKKNPNFCMCRGEFCYESRELVSLRVVHAKLVAGTVLMATRAASQATCQLQEQKCYRQGSKERKIPLVLVQQAQRNP